MRTRDLTNAQYHALPSLSASGAKKVLRSIAHYLTPTETTTAMRLGTAIHTAILEPDAFPDVYSVRPDGIDLRTKEGKAWAADNAHLTLLRPEDYATCVGIADALRRNPITRALLAKGVAEMSYQVHDPEYGIDLRIRPDFVTASGMMVDLKSTQDARADAFARACVTFGYDVQQAFYQRVHKIETGEDCDFVFVAVEKEAPFGVSVYTLDEVFVDRGVKLLHEALKRYADWHHAGRPDISPYPEVVAMLSPPAWASRGVYE